MTLKNIQQQVDGWTRQFTPQYWPPHEIIAQLVEETGELAREINHRFGTKKKKNTEDTKEVGEEMADILFAICCLANSQNIDLDAAFAGMMDKLKKRDNNRFEKSLK